MAVESTNSNVITYGDITTLYSMPVSNLGYTGYVFAPNIPNGSSIDYSHSDSFTVAYNYLSNSNNVWAQRYSPAEYINFEYVIGGVSGPVYKEHFGEEEELFRI